MLSGLAGRSSPSAPVFAASKPYRPLPVPPSPRRTGAFHATASGRGPLVQVDASLLSSWLRPEMLPHQASQPARQAGAGFVEM